jgi:flagellar biogenesis protein FliO|tara:strand:+ start:151 stop:768 length:618 start_codon:yes stop_codon:yes gene_type:complete
MWLVCAWVLFQMQDTGLPLPPDVDRSVPLEVVEAAPLVEEAKPLQERIPVRPRKLVERSSDGPKLGNFILWSSVVVVLLIGFFVVFRRFTKNSRLFGTNRTIDVIGKRGLGPRQAIFLVEVGGKVLVVGSTRENLSTLGEIQDREEIASLRQASQGSPNGDIFRKSLNEGLREYEQEPGKKKSSRYTGLIEELSELKKTVGAWRA